MVLKQTYAQNLWGSCGGIAAFAIIHSRTHMIYSWAPRSWISLIASVGSSACGSHLAATDARLSRARRCVSALVLVFSCCWSISKWSKLGWHKVTTQVEDWSRQTQKPTAWLAQNDWFQLSALTLLRLQWIQRFRRIIMNNWCTVKSEPLILILSFVTMCLYRKGFQLCLVIVCSALFIVTYTIILRFSFSCWL